MRSETPAASRGDRGDRAGAVRRAGGGHAPHVVLPLREHTHVPVKRESAKLGDGSSTKAGRLTHLRHWYKFVTFRNFVTDWRFESFEGGIRMGE